MKPAIKATFGFLSKISPQLAGALAYRLFTTPLKTAGLTQSERRLERRAANKLRAGQDISFNKDAKRIAAYRFGEIVSASGKRIVVVHGWMSGARFMLAIVNSLTEQGHEVIVLDLPAHGGSQGTRTDLIDSAKALALLLDNIEPPDRIVAHSFGGAVVGYTLSRLKPNALAEKGEVVLLASPNRLASVTRGFSQSFGLSGAAQTAYETRLTKALDASLDEMDGNLMYGSAGYPLRIIHCVDDEEVSVEEGRRFVEAEVEVEIVELSGMGHRRILYHPRALAALKALI